MRTKGEVRRRVTGPVVAVVLITVLYLWVFVWLVQSWLGDPYYGHGFLIPLISGFIFWLRRHNLKTARASLLGATLLGAGLAVYIFAFIWGMRSLAAFSFLIVVFGTITYLCGRERSKTFVFPTLFLIFMIPMPFISSISYHLQTITTHSSAAIARLFGIPAVITGNQIELPDASFVVGIPCSGISSLISLLALAAIMAFVVSGSSWKRGVLFLSAFPIAILANTIRVASVLLIGNKWGSEAAMGFFHGFSSILLFLLAIALLILLARLLRCKFRTLMELAHG